MSLINAWSEIVGRDVAKCCRPEKIIWQNRNPVEKKGVLNDVGGTLIIACKGSHVVFLMHDQSKIIRNVNVFLDFVLLEEFVFFKDLWLLQFEILLLPLLFLEKMIVKKLTK
ncbi:DciA family protein [Candidatus Liberibacter africanus]|uniref:DciA family protein n=1 Tax=Liberibacter africanus TaxID=34020 RepID=UPI001FD505A9|nr:DciA family protein [Candidatus Liberibacter africanus]